LPILRPVAIDRPACWAGLYEMTPDKHAVVGRVGNAWVAGGSSGHGVMHAPAIGELVAGLILGGRTSMDISALRPERFARGKPNPVDGLL
jgi:sarcosine oxidase subunit beta